MAIDILQQNDNVYNDPGSSFTLTHTVSGGSQRLLLVLVGYENEDFEAVASVKWDVAGVNETLTPLPSCATVDDAFVQAFYKIAPSDGIDKLITVNLTGSLDNAGASIIAFTLGGVDQSTPIRDSDCTAEQTPNTLSVTVSTSAGDFLAVHANQEATGQTMDYDSSTFTVTLTQDNVDAGTAPTFHSGYGTADTTSETAQIDSTVSEHMALQLVAVAPTASSSSSSSSSSLSSSSSSSSSSLSSSSSSSSLSSSSSSTTPGTVSWGQVTGVEEDFTRTFAGNVTSSGPTSGWAVSGSGDEEILYLINVPNCGQIVLFEPWYLGAFEAIINEDKYRTGSGEEDTWFYITASTKQGLFIGSWTMYNGVSFTSLGWVWIRLIHT